MVSASSVSDIICREIFSLKLRPPISDLRPLISRPSMAAMKTMNAMKAMKAMKALKATKAMKAMKAMKAAKTMKAMKDMEAMKKPAAVAAKTKAKQAAVAAKTKAKPAAVAARPKRMSKPIPAVLRSHDFRIVPLPDITVGEIMDDQQSQSIDNEGGIFVPVLPEAFRHLTLEELIMQYSALSVRNLRFPGR